MAKIKAIIKLILQKLHILKKDVICDVIDLKDKK